MTTYNILVKQAIKAGFEDYCNTYNEDGLQGTIFTNTKTGSPFNGEVLDIFEDGTFTHYSQFADNHPHYSPLKFKFISTGDFSQCDHCGTDYISPERCPECFPV